MCLRAPLFDLKSDLDPMTEWDLIGLKKQTKLLLRLKPMKPWKWIIILLLQIHVAVNHPCHKKRKLSWSFSGFYLLCSESKGVSVLRKVSDHWCGGCSENSAYNLKFHLSLNIIFVSFFILCANSFANINFNFLSLLDWLICLPVCVFVNEIKTFIIALKMSKMRLHIYN